MSSLFDRERLVTGIKPQANRERGKRMDTEKRKEPTPTEPTPPEGAEPESKPEPKPEGDLDS